MARFHINPKTGNAGQCRAVRSCPFGDMKDDHFDSKEDARKAFEERFEGDKKHLKSATAMPLRKNFTMAAKERLFDALAAGGFLGESERAQNYHRAEFDPDSRQEHWYSNGVVEVKVLSQSWNNTLELVNSRSVENQQIRDLFKALEEPKTSA